MWMHVPHKSPRPELISNGYCNSACTDCNRSGCTTEGARPSINMTLLLSLECRAISILNDAEYEVMQLREQE